MSTSATLVDGISTPELSVASPLTALLGGLPDRREILPRKEGYATEGWRRGNRQERGYDTACSGYKFDWAEHVQMALVIN